jgi:transposase-like protein
MFVPGDQGVAKRVGKIGIMKCPKCEETRHQHKIGKTKAGSQRIRCYSCGCSYTPKKKVQGYDQALRQKAIKMYVDGAGLRRTGRQLGVHHQSVANWAKEHAEQLPKAPVPEEVKAAEFDELFTYIGDKKTESTWLPLWIEKPDVF